MRFILLCICMFAFRVNKAFSQDITVQMGKVVYTTIKYDQDTALKKRFAETCEVYRESYYGTKKLPLTYLVISSTISDTSVYELAFDNLRGNSITNSEYDRHKTYDAPGIRIKILAKDPKEEELLQLFDYAINHLNELKKIRKNGIKNSLPDTLSLSSERINYILRSVLSDKVSDFITKEPRRSSGI
jgi:hypothetical protein